MAILMSESSLKRPISTYFEFQNSHANSLFLVRMRTFCELRLFWMLTGNMQNAKYESKWKWAFIQKHNGWGDMKIQPRTTISVKSLRTSIIILGGCNGAKSQKNFAFSIPRNHYPLRLCSYLSHSSGNHKFQSLLSFFIFVTLFMIYRYFNASFIMTKAELLLLLG